MLRDGSEIPFWGRTPASGTGPLQTFAPGADLNRSFGQASGGSDLDRQFHLDEQGNVLAVTDQNQSALATMLYDASGNSLQGSLADNPADYVGNQGQWWDQDTGLLYVKAR